MHLPYWLLKYWSFSTSTKKQATSGLSGSSFVKTTSRKTSESDGGEVKGIKRPSEDGSHTVYSGGKVKLILILIWVVTWYDIPYFPVHKTHCVFLLEILEKKKRWMYDSTE